MRFCILLILVGFCQAIYLIFHKILQLSSDFLKLTYQNKKGCSITEQPLKYFMLMD